MNESGEFRWYVAHTYSGYENKVKDNIEKTVENRNLQDLIAEVCIPTEEVKTLVKKKKATAGKTNKRKKSVSEEEIADVDFTASESDDENYEIVEKVAQRKLYPGYVFVKMIMTSESWYIVRNTRGCTGFVGPESKPVPLTESEVYSLGVEKVEINIPFEEGDSVRISGGSFEGYMGEIRAIDKERLKITVMITMFGGREMELEVDLNEVEAL